MSRKLVLRAAVTLAATTATVAAMAAAPALARPAPTGPGTAPARISPARHQAILDRQERMADAQRVAPSLSPLTTATTFTVNATGDSDLANPADTHCVDALNGKCSLRAAIHAANNLKKPVRVVLGSHTYTLTLHAALVVSDPAGVSVVGNGAGNTAIDGDNATGVFYVDGASSGDPGALLFLTGLTVTGGAATSGGGIYLGDISAGSTAVLKDVVISHNTASTGGGIYASDYDSLYMSNTKVTHNTAGYGGGIYSYWANERFVNVSITYNTAAANDDGGGIYNEYGVLEISGGTISHNTAGDDTHVGYGGGIWDEYGDLTLNGVSVDYNSAKDDGDGGGIYAYYDQIDFTKGSISHNSAVGTTFASGGGIYASDGAQIGLHGVTLAADTAGGTNDGSGGGAALLYGYEYGTQLVIDAGSKITGATGSAIYGYAAYGNVDVSISHSTLSGNHDTANNGMSSYGCGGAVCMYDNNSGSVNLEMIGNTVSGNTSVGNYGGGAVSVYGYSYGGGTVALSHNRFTNNHTGANGYGGAVLIWDDDYYAPFSVRSSSNTFSDNRAGTAASAGYGGALAIYDYAVLTDTGSKFIDNQAVGSGAYGGAVYDGSYQSARYTRTAFTGNTTGGYGGAVYTNDEAGDVFDRVTIAGNTAVNSGGGIYGDSDAYQLELKRSTVSGNTAGTSTNEGYGGGIYADDAVLVLENSTVSGNRARSYTTTDGQGGGIWFCCSTLGLRYSTVSGNFAAQGGGIYADGSGGTLLASIVSANHKSPGGAEQDCTTASAPATLLSVGQNVLGKATCAAHTQPSDKVTIHPGLKPLANNGGATKTMALKATSPAIDRGGSFCPSTDERGQPRHAAHCDAGAYERAAGSVGSVSPHHGHAGTTVTIKGSGFTFARHVHFGKRAAQFHVVSDTKIVVKHAPKGPEGEVRVTVSTPDGAGKVGSFTYLS